MNCKKNVIILNLLPIDIDGIERVNINYKMTTLEYAINIFTYCLSVFISLYNHLNTKLYLKLTKLYTIGLSHQWFSLVLKPIIQIVFFNNKTKSFLFY